MKPSTFLKRYLADLKTWAAAIKPGNQVVLAKDPNAALYMLATAPQGFLAVLVSDGDRRIGPREEPAYTHSFSLFIQINRMLDAQPHTAIIEERPGDLPPLLDVVEDAAMRIRELTFADEDMDHTADYQGSSSVSLPSDAGAVALPAYRLTFTIDYAADAVTPRNYTPPEE